MEAIPRTTAAQITLDANHAEGAGGKGQRHWVGDGTNEGSGGLNIVFTEPHRELWIRWYIRWQAGFRWDPAAIDGDLSGGCGCAVARGAPAGWPVAPAAVLLALALALVVSRAGGSRGRRS